MGPGLLLLFVVGDILGTGVYALTGKVAAEVGGAVWLPFLVAFIVALLTAFSYLELVTKYPRAAGAALYTHKAFGIHFLTFIVTFAVMCSGLTSASSASKAFARTSPRRSTCRSARAPALTAVALALHDPDRAGQLPRRRRERQAQRAADLRRADRPADHHLHRRLGARRRQRRPVPADRVQRGRGRERLLLGHRGDRAGVLRDGRLRGLGEHGRGDQGPGPDLPQGDADRPVHHRRHLRAGVHLVGGPGRARRTSARATRRCSRWSRPARPRSRCGSSRSSRCSRWPTRR